MKSMTDDKEISVVWSWLNRHYATVEKFQTRREAWARVQEIMAMRSDHFQHAKSGGYVAFLEVVQDNDKGGVKVAQFQRYIEGSDLRRWGPWGVYCLETAGEPFG